MKRDTQNCPYCEESPEMEYKTGGKVECPNCGATRLC